MNYNNLNFEENTKKVLHKVKKSWIVISLASFTLLGVESFSSNVNKSTPFVSSSVVSADTNSYDNNSEQTNLADQQSIHSVSSATINIGDSLPNTAQDYEAKIISNSTETIDYNAKVDLGQADNQNPGRYTVTITFSDGTIQQTSLTVMKINVSDSISIMQGDPFPVGEYIPYQNMPDSLNFSSEPAGYGFLVNTSSVNTDVAGKYECTIYYPGNRNIRKTFLVNVISPTERKNVNETIHYQYPDGTESANTYTKSLTFTRSAEIDPDTGEVTYGDWSSDQIFEAVQSPSLKGYTPDQAEIATQTVSGISQDLNFTVKYMKNAPAESTDTKTVNETIHYQYPDGTNAADTYTKSLTFTRAKYTDAVTGEVTYGSWSTDQTFEAVQSPSLKGYTPDQAEIAAQMVNGDSQDLNFTVKYMKDATDSNNQDGSNTPSNPSSNGTDSTSSETTKTQTAGKPLPSKQQHTTRLEKYHNLPDTAKKDQGYGLAGLLGISAILVFFGLSKSRKKRG
ncbi:mucin-binding protein [Fructobacillus parabroussonetiae]|uniref:Mub B2-like domain-containing protein n=1 Tax=Fructobacillus parabroussonetiae TaxID=2713174 RepID=A0ABS5QXU9_9LACO|nr:hypothetical protein [Fructobacillus parabroussonetiae]MBS9338018.1 hypothetical protein [Fructobacillus parabroussonetiae]